ncbi:hypothetical protein EDF57_103208 [Novosphingobium sp. PhB55]|uniref:hypothetical protein n=1 Tax=Novosphingobium sp. PhB55 TaxID=2485106 RepID=UPI0010670F73|nr:hypothetical protein [Novosphingobium sp. PhB55]TDW65032.1 hypothetical protein EDF57_103208 [Novosphingobium sp. PhB55]
MKYMTACAAVALAAPAVAQPTFEELKQETADITSLIDAENAKTDLCKRYVGTVVTPTTFDALALSLPKMTDKGEYETTAQHEARKAAAPTGLSGLFDESSPTASDPTESARSLKPILALTIY